MPVVGVSVARLNALLRREYAAREIYEALDWLGCDVQEIATAVIHECPDCAVLVDRLPEEDVPQLCNSCGSLAPEPFAAVGFDEQIRIELLPARPDILDIGGLARALKGFFLTEVGLPSYPVEKGTWQLDVDPSVASRDSYRPAIAAAVVEVPPIDGFRLQELLRLQKHMHWAVGRNRKLCSVGLADLSTLEPPLCYTTTDPGEKAFVPFGHAADGPWTPRRILDEHPMGIRFAHLLREPHPGMARYPILADGRGRVVSLSPILNSHETRIRVGTTRVLVYVTGTGQALAESCLNTLICSIWEMKARRIEAVEVRFSSVTRSLPDLKPRRAALHIGRTRALLGLTFSDAEFVRLLKRMRNGVVGSGPGYEVIYPAYRTDIKHEVDLMEDVAIAYGFANFPTPLVHSLTTGSSRPEERHGALVRSALLGLGYLELVNFMLVDPSDHDRLRLGKPASLVRIANPGEPEQGAFRMTLLGGLLDTLRRNTRSRVPQRVFEIGSVAFLDKVQETGASEERRLAFALLGPAAAFAEGRSVLDSLAHEMGWGELDYRAAVYPTFREGRTAEVLVPGGSHLAWLGEVHPETLKHYGLAHPLVMAEVTLPFPQ